MIINFFAEYMKGNNLGKIANAHLVQADRSLKLALDERCLYLAEQHSIEVDFPKTGISGTLREEDRTREYPDFMEKEDTLSTYESQSILGKLYRKTKDIQFSVFNSEEFNEVVAVNVDKELIEPGFESQYMIADANYKAYARDMRVLLKQFGIQSEAELVSGSINELSKFHTVKKDKDDILERIQKSLTLLVQKHRKLFERNLTEDIRTKRASAYYIVAYLSLIHICRCRRLLTCRSRWSPYH
eukprot:TRINITY_DN15276_c0_g1_i7.p1 TRINITY_DN15276_c0_g1~~TRINITY_DN15276_c0_g1_i7.p1  ORF type:complete len:243 (-),score=73.91 TRINITY_DN15276_c0_g1_i7:15-743(-)